jgi:hypothetical protein
VAVGEVARVDERAGGAALGLPKALDERTAKDDLGEGLDVLGDGRRAGHHQPHPVKAQLRAQLAEDEPIPQRVLSRARVAQRHNLRGERAREEGLGEAALGLHAGHDLVVDPRVEPRHRHEERRAQRADVLDQL